MKAEEVKARSGRLQLMLRQVGVQGSNPPSLADLSLVYQATQKQQEIRLCTLLLGNNNNNPWA